MGLSKTWDMNDNAYKLSQFREKSIYNEGSMCMFEVSFDGMVNRSVAVFAKKYGRKEGLLYNNRLYLSVLEPQKKHKQQYEANRKWILKNVK